MSSYVRQYQQALSINSFGAPVGGLIGPVVATSLADAFGWSVAFVRVIDLWGRDREVGRLF